MEHSGPFSFHQANQGVELSVSVSCIVFETCFKLMLADFDFQMEQFVTFFLFLFFLIVRLYQRI